MTDVEKFPGLSGRVGLVVPKGMEGSADLLAEALVTGGAREVMRLPATSGTPQPLPVRVVLALDRLCSRFLPGARLPRVGAPAPVNAHAPLDAAVVVGASSPPDAPHVYKLELGDARDDETIGLSETLARRPVAWLSLRRRASGTNEPQVVVAEMAVQTDRYSITRTAAALAATAPAFLAAATTPGAKAATGHEPAAAFRLGWLGVMRHGLRLLHGLFERLYLRAQWVLAVVPHDGDLDRARWEKLKLLRPPSDRFWADPFVSVKDGRCWLFFEEAPFSSAKGRNIGHIAVAELGADGELGPIQTALDRTWHLSYPHVFEHEGEWYMLPEQGKTGRVDLYHCKAWPAEWRLHSTLLDEPGYDATLMPDGAAWALTTARRAKGAGTADFLDLHEAPSPLGPWRLRRRGAVADVRSARPAGRVMADRSGLLRPAQDSSGGVYGRALRVQRTLLDGVELSEHTVVALEPAPGSGVRGVHTLAVGGGFIVVDLCLSAPRLRFLPRPMVREPFVISVQ